MGFPVKSFCLACISCSCLGVQGLRGVGFRDYGLGLNVLGPKD